MLASPFNKKKGKQSSALGIDGSEGAAAGGGKRPSRKGKRPSGGLVYKPARDAGAGAGAATLPDLDESPRISRKSSLDRKALAGLGIAPAVRASLEHNETAEVADQIVPVPAAAAVPPKAAGAGSPNVGVLPSKEAWEAEKQRRLDEQNSAPTHGTEEDLRALEAIIMSGSEGMYEQRSEAPPPVIVVDDAGDDRFVESVATAERVPTITVTNPAFDEPPPATDFAPSEGNGSLPADAAAVAAALSPPTLSPPRTTAPPTAATTTTTSTTTTTATIPIAAATSSPTLVVRGAGARSADAGAGAGGEPPRTRSDGGRGSFEEVPLALRERGKPATWSGPDSEGYSGKLAVQSGRSLRSSGKHNPEKRFTLVGSTAVEVLSPLASAEPYSMGSAHRRRLAHMRQDAKARSAPSSPTLERKIEFSSDA